MDDKKMEFIGKALEVYMRYGIKSVTMDEMARQVGVSKKTIYQYVTDKNDLVEQCIQCAQMMDIEMIKIIITQNDNAIDEVLAISKYVGEEINKIHPSIFFDLAKYHPSAMNMMKCHKDDFIRDTVKQNLERGIKQGLYRENMNVDIISKVYLTTMDHVLVGDIFDTIKITPDQVRNEQVLKTHPHYLYHSSSVQNERPDHYYEPKLLGIQISQI
jgi:AcrR family transcriptional regulator